MREKIYIDILSVLPLTIAFFVEIDTNQNSNFVLDIL